jgi:predicted ribosomally synthesized peptide with SipW-like signal peptide
MTEKYELSRRKTLAGLATIGAAGAGAGLGTSALFSDEETFEENTITAGTLDMEVTATVEAANPYWEEQGVTGLNATADGEAVTGVEIADVKPGDWGIFCFEISIAENPGYVQVSTANLESNENGYTEPEPEDDNGEGELEENTVAEIYNSFDAGADSSPPRSHLSDQDPTTPDGTTLVDAYDTYSTGVTIGGSAEPTVVGSGEEGAVEFCLLLEIPDDVGNEIQSDSLSFDLVFATEQVRNNDTPFNSSA